MKRVGGLYFWVCVNQIRKHCGTWEPRASELGSRTYSGLNDKGHCSALTGRRGEYSAPGHISNLCNIQWPSREMDLHSTTYSTLPNSRHYLGQVVLNPFVLLGTSLYLHNVKKHCKPELNENETLFSHSTTFPKPQGSRFPPGRVPL